ncbi:MAG: hypothetical protein ACON5H_11625 [Akkermansiaceae bacterium]
MMNTTTKLIAFLIVAAAVGALSSCGSAPEPDGATGPIVIDRTK